MQQVQTKLVFFSLQDSEVRNIFFVEKAILACPLPQKADDGGHGCSALQNAGMMLLAIPQHEQETGAFGRVGGSVLDSRDFSSAPNELENASA